MISIILAGGSGVRFWPLSRETHPKQLLKISGENTLIQETIARLLPIIPIENTCVVTNEQHALKTRDQLSGLGFDPKNLLAEPVGKNTAPAIALAAEWLKDREDEVMAVFPADHIIKDPETLHAALKQGEAIASQGYLVTLGIRPTRPETGYGYIKSGSSLNDTVYQVERFVEKPDLDTAKAFMEEGDYFWNCGIFLWKVSAIREELQRHLPDVFKGLKGIDSHLTDAGGKSPYRVLDAEGKEIYESLPSVSIDYGVMEKSDKVAVVTTSMQWSDVGCWNALEEISVADAEGNVLSPDVFQIDCSGSIVKSDGRMIAALGLKDLIVVDTADALLVCPKDRAQEVKQLVELIKSHDREETKVHTKVDKPWGSYTVLDQKDRYLLKRIDVLPGERLSLQSHQHRSEHWVVTAGRAEVQCDDKTFILETNQSTFIPKGARHRLSNVGDTLLILIETQVGDILDENDIKRYSDLYGRA